MKIRDKARDAARDAMMKKGMDASEVEALVKREVAAAAPDIGKIKSEIRKEENAKASLYGRLSPIIGAFDHAEMSHAEMAAYGLKKFGAPEASDPVTALDFYLAGRTQVIQPARVAQDSATVGESFMDKYLAT
jgi:hypothetical protein